MQQHASSIHTDTVAYCSWWHLLWKVCKFALQKIVNNTKCKTQVNSYIGKYYIKERECYISGDTNGTFKDVT